MAKIAPNILTTKVKAALRNPPKIVSAYLDAGAVASAKGNGQEQAIPGASPAGGSSEGWWSNGAYLIYKDTTIAYRDNESRTLSVISSFAGLFSVSGLIKGMTIKPIVTFD